MNGAITTDWCTVLQGDCLEQLRRLPAGLVQTCVTSPPYWGLRNYDVPPTTWSDGWVGCLGQEPTPQQFVTHLVEIFAEVRRVLRPDGTLWLNLGDSYCGARGGEQGQTGECADRTAAAQNIRVRKETRIAPGLKLKDLTGVPWRAALALQADGWWLRQDIIWHKPNPMPAPVTDRCVTAHEYLFLLSKASEYHFDHEAIREAAVSVNDPRNRPDYVPVRKRNVGGRNDGFTSPGVTIPPDGKRNRRSVWTVSTRPFRGAHFATFPPPTNRALCARGIASGGHRA